MVPPDISRLARTRWFLSDDVSQGCHKILTGEVSGGQTLDCGDRVALDDHAVACGANTTITGGESPGASLSTILTASMTTALRRLASS